MSIRDIFDICLPTSYDCTESISAVENSSGSWSGARAKYARSSRLYKVRWETATHAEAYDIVHMWNSLGGEVQRFEMHFPGDSEPVEVQFNSAPRVTEMSPVIAMVEVEFREVL